MNQYDIVIVGAGTAGMMCAIFAARRNLKILVLEKDNKVGGSMHWSGGHMSAGGTNLQKRLGIQDDPDMHYQDIMRINGGTGDQNLIRKAVDLAPDMINWLEENNFEFDPICPRIVYGHVPYETARTYYGVENAKTTLKTIMPFWVEGVERGNISIKYNHTVQRLEKNNGRYNEVHFESPEGKGHVKGNHILITTGGYGSNPEFFHSKHPGIPLISAAYPTATADGFYLLAKEGSPFRFGEHHLSSLGGIESPVGSGKCDFYEGWASVLTSVYRKPRDIYIDRDGNRFMNEDEINPDTRERILLAKDIWHFWIIFDEAALMERDENGVENPIIINWDTNRMKEETRRERFLFVADSLEALANKIDVPSTNLVKTTERFNQFVDSGVDSDFDRAYLNNKVSEAPYYALKVHASVIATFGGVTVDKDLRVLNKEGEILKGLYAAGEILGLGATSGGAFCSGMAITPALSFGRWLGETLAMS